jgi:hypothetical protein
MTPHRFWTFLSVLFATAWASSVAADSYILNYRAGTQEAWNVPGFVAGGDAAVSGWRTVTGASERSPYNDMFWRAWFDGNGDYIAARSAIQFNLDRGFTVQVWFRPDSLTGRQVLISNAESSGFSFRLNEDRLESLVRVNDRYETLRSTKPLVIGNWYVATLTAAPVNLLGYRYLLTQIFVDGESAGSLLSSLSSTENLVNSPVRPLIGAEPDANGLPSLGYEFQGRIHAVTVRDYPVSSSYASVRVPHDHEVLHGAPDFDAPGVHDSHPIPLPPDLAVSFDQEGPGVRAEMFLPFGGSNYIVQGVAHSREGGQSNARNLLYLSMYWKNVEGEVAEPGSANRSILVEADLELGRITRCFRVTDKSSVAGPDQSYGHLGGIAYFKGSLYVASDGWVRRYPLGTVPAGAMANEDLCTDLAPNAAYDTRFASYISYGKVGGVDSMLIGNAGTGGGAVRHTLDANGALSSSSVDTYWAPQGQGIDVWKGADGKEYLMVAVSHGGNATSDLHRMLVSEARCVSGTCTEPPSHKVCNEIPAGIEDTANVGGTIWSASESGARYYRLRTTPDLPAWKDFYPFVMTLRPAEMSFAAP